VLTTYGGGGFGVGLGNAGIVFVAAGILLVVSAGITSATRRGRVASSGAGSVRATSGTLKAANCTRYVDVPAFPEEASLGEAAGSTLFSEFEGRSAAAALGATC